MFPTLVNATDACGEWRFCPSKRGKIAGKAAEKKKEKKRKRKKKKKKKKEKEKGLLVAGTSLENSVERVPGSS